MNAGMHLPLPVLDRVNGSFAPIGTLVKIDHLDQAQVDWLDETLVPRLLHQGDNWGVETLD
jgi:hypothetical protein